jgi:hypothetical protein
MEPVKYLQEADKTAGELDTREEVNRVIDELESIYETLDPQFQDLASDLIDRLSSRLKEL